MKIKCFQNLSQSISGSRSQLRMVFCHFELHLNVATTSSNGIQYIRHKEKLQKVSEKTPQLHIHQSPHVVAIQPRSRKLSPWKQTYLKNSYLSHNIHENTTICNLASCVRKPYPQVKELRDIHQNIPEISNKLTSKIVMSSLSTKPRNQTTTTFIFPCDMQAFRIYSSFVLILIFFFFH